MTRLIAKTPLDGMAPVKADGATLSEAAIGRITSVAPFRGRETAVSTALKAAFGFGFPGPNQTAAEGAARIVWSGQGQAFLIGVAPPEGLADLAALTDQTDGWAILHLEGARAEAALARLVPLDLRAARFKRGQTARTMLFHMTCGITRVGAQKFEIMVLRSFGRTAAHDLEVAIRSVAAQG